MWLLFHHYIFPSGSSRGRFLCADVEAPHVGTVRPAWRSWTVCANRSSGDSGRPRLGEQLWDAYLSVRFSSFNTLSFFKT